MIKNISLLTVVVLWLVFATAHAFFKTTELYWFYLWLDIPMHLAGGFLVVMTWFVLQRRFIAGEKIFSQKFFHPLIILAIMMVAWEIYKYMIGDIVMDNYVSDTILDLIMGTVGGLIAFKLFLSRTIDK
ncbi:MAG: hypothetical protein H6779_03765 [Candidatus Nomurabacteria bacterium]|nr:MAG: hypothetical protein H6779_03765 [Candidatus Nomurabacteria bacterium]